MVEFFSTVWHLLIWFLEMPVWITHTCSEAYISAIWATFSAPYGVSACALTESDVTQRDPPRFVFNQKVLRTVTCTHNQQEATITGNWLAYHHNILWSIEAWFPLMNFLVHVSGEPALDRVTRWQTRTSFFFHLFVPECSLYVCYRQDMFHRDIKPENILIRVSLCLLACWIAGTLAFECAI